MYARIDTAHARTHLEVVVAPAEAAVDGLRVLDQHARALGLRLALGQLGGRGRVNPELGEAALAPVEHDVRGEAGDALELRGGVVLEHGRPLLGARGGQRRAHEDGVEVLLALWVDARGVVGGCRERLAIQSIS